MILPHVSDHAVRRYLERVHDVLCGPRHLADHAALRFAARGGLNIAAIRTKIAALCAGPIAAGACALRADGHTFEFQNGMVATVTLNRAVRVGKTKARIVMASAGAA